MSTASLRKGHFGSSFYFLILCALALSTATACTSPDEYSSAASPGDLLTYAIDTEAMTYSYEVIDSDFGLEGTKKSGLLIDNGDFTYSPLDEPNLDLAPFPDTLLVGHLSLPDHQGVFFAGVPSVEGAYVPEDIAGTYNWVGGYCDSALVDGDCPTAYQSHYGTLRIDLGGTAEVCMEGDIETQAQHPCQTLHAVTWQDTGDGLIELSLADVPYATLMIHQAGAEKVMAIDVKNRPEGAYPASNRGPGMCIGVNKYVSTGADLDGAYFGVQNLMEEAGSEYYMKSMLNPDDTYEIAVFFVDSPDQPAAVYTGSLIRDLPWEGWVTTDDSDTLGHEQDRIVLILPASGTYLAVSPTGATYFYAGGRLNCTDTDDDGYAVEASCLYGADCDDSDPDINPGAQEICDDGIDNNCDGYECTGLIPDPNLEMKIREALGIPVADLTPADLLGLTELDARQSEIGDLTGLEYCLNLTELYLYSNHIDDIGPLSALVNLTVLDVSYNDLYDIAPLAGLVHLTELRVGGNAIVDITPLSGLVNLTDLSLFDSKQILDISPLASLTNLTTLNLSYCWSVADINPLAGLVNLTNLSLYLMFLVDDVSPLAGLVNLSVLDLSRNSVVDASPLAGLVNLTRLSLGGNAIVDITPVSGLVNLTDLDLGGNAIVDLTPLSGFVELDRLGLVGNQIADIYPLVQNPGVVSWLIQLGGNPLNTDSCNVYVPDLRSRGVTVYETCE